MTRSQANYALHEAVADSELNGSRPVEDEYRDYRDPVSMTAGGYPPSNRSRIR